MHYSRLERWFTETFYLHFLFILLDFFLTSIKNQELGLFICIIPKQNKPIEYKFSVNEFCLQNPSAAH